MANKNYMKQVAEMLGVKLDEGFYLGFNDKEPAGMDIYRLNENEGLVFRKYIGSKWYRSDALKDILSGKYVIFPISIIKKDTKIFSVFPASGKTYAAKKLTEEGYKVLDLDSSEYSHKYYNFSVDGYEVDRVKNPSFPQNYIKAIKDAIGEYDFIFISTHREVREELEKNNIRYSLVYPNCSMKNEWVGRCYLKGDKELCDKLANNWNQWNKELDNVTYNNAGCTNRVFLNSSFDTRYLYDAIKKYYIKGE